MLWIVVGAASRERGHRVSLSRTARRCLEPRESEHTSRAARRREIEVACTLRLQVRTHCGRSNRRARRPSAKGGKPAALLGLFPSIKHAAQKHERRSKSKNTSDTSVSSARSLAACARVRLAAAKHRWPPARCSLCARPDRPTAGCAALCGGEYIRQQLQAAAVCLAPALAAVGRARHRLAVLCCTRAHGGPLYLS